MHHTAGTNNYSAAEVPKIIRGIYAYHVKANGWSDIGYNFLVDRFGRLWEGRYGGITRAVLGAHTGGFNVDTFAVSAIGNYDKVARAGGHGRLDRPADGVEALAVRSGTRTPRPSLTSQGGGTSKYRPAPGHLPGRSPGTGTPATPPARETTSTRSWPTIRALTTAYLGTALLDPHPSPASAVYGRDGSISIVSRVTSDQQWSLEVRQVCDGAVVRTVTGSASPTVPVQAVWDLRDSAGAPVRPGAYTVTLASADATAAARTWTGQVTVQAARTTPPATAATALPGQSGFVPVDPVKLYDTRADGNLPLGPGGRVDLTVPGVGRLPASGIGAVALSIASSCATAPTSVTAWAAGSPRPASPA